MPGPKKFPLKLDDGTEIRRLEELRERADLPFLVDRYHTGALLRWLRVWGYQAEADRVESLSTDQEDFRPALCAALGISYTEEMEAGYQAYLRKSSEDLAAREKKIQAETAPAKSVEDGRNSSVPSRPSYDPDAVAAVMRMDYGNPRYIETEDYFFGPDQTLISTNSRFDKRTGAVIKNLRGPEHALFIFSASGQYFERFAWIPYGAGSEKLRIQIFYVAPDREFAGYMMYSVWRYDVEKMEETKVVSLGHDMGTVSLSPTICSGKLACYSGYRKKLWIVDIQTGERKDIPLEGDNDVVFASGNVVFHEDTLFFAYEKRRDFLRDEKENTYYVCAYDLKTERTRVLWSKTTEEHFDLSPILSVRGNHLYFGTQSKSGLFPSREEWKCQYYHMDIKTLAVSQIEAPPGNTCPLPNMFCRNGIVAFEPRKRTYTPWGEPTKLYYLPFSEPTAFQLLTTNLFLTSTGNEPVVFREIGNWFYYCSSICDVSKVRPGSPPQPVRLKKEGN